VRKHSGRETAISVGADRARRAFSELLQHEIDHLDGILAVDRALDRESLCTREEYVRRYRSAGWLL